MRLYNRIRCGQFDFFCYPISLHRKYMFISVRHAKNYTGMWLSLVVMPMVVSCMLPEVNKNILT
uniref:Uncharacterized protein n=1 Tax=Arundo donax TaxID=35708 RepID=A0A0A9BY87_ARUDO